MHSEEPTREVGKVMTSIEDLVGHEYGNSSEESRVTNDLGNGKDKKKNEEKTQKAKQQYAAYKYSNKGKGPLHEAAILAGRPVFLKYENGDIKIIDQIEETTRIIKPPSPEEYPYEPYEFSNMAEVHVFVNRAKSEDNGSLYQKSKSFVKLYNDQDDYKLNLVAADIEGSYFQDKFSTTHYLGVIGDNGSGKSTIGDTFEAIGYRPVNMTDPTAANFLEY